MWTRALTTATAAALIGLTGGAQIPLAAQGAAVPRSAAKETMTPGGNLKDVLYFWANHMGMLRGTQEADFIGTLDLVGTGTITVGGQPCRLTKYHATINYQVSGMRVEYACTLPNGQTREEIPVVSGQYAWNEVGGPGAGLVPGKGQAVPARDAYAERAIRLWSWPQGAVKAAVMGGENTKIGVEGGKTTVTYPIPGVPGAIAKATLLGGQINGLCTRNCAERVEVRQGDVVTEFNYSNYADYNHPEEQLDAFFAGRIVEKRGPLTVLDLTVTRTQTANLYIVVPVPASVRSAGPVATQR
jgi:hypothetical protein